MDGYIIVIGANEDGDNNGNIRPGSAYLFDLFSGGSWTKNIRLTASHGAAGVHFANSVAISTDSIVVCAWNGGTSTGGADSGKAYVYLAQSGAGTWTDRAILTASLHGSYH